MDDLNNDYQREVDWIIDAIRNTPRAPRNVVKAYHEPIKARLDSGRYIKVGSQGHKSYHQAMWMETYVKSNPCPSREKGEVCFVLGPVNGVCENCRCREFLEGFNSESERLDVFYAKDYELDKEDEYARKDSAKADIETRNSKGIGLREVAILLD